MIRLWKTLYAYVYYICFRDTSVERYQGLRIAVSHSAMLELVKESKTLQDVVKILNEGYDAPRKRKGQSRDGWTKVTKHTMS